MAEIVATNNVNAGMVVSEPVVNSFGQTLISTGVEINEQHIKLLKMWNISCISIKTSIFNVKNFENCKLSCIWIAKQRRYNFSGNLLYWIQRNKKHCSYTIGY